MLLQQQEPRSKAALAQPEDVLPFAAEDAPDQAPAQTSDPDDPLDWYAFGPHALDQQVGFLAPLKAVELEAFRRRQDGWFQLGAAGYGGHCATDGGLERVARVLQEVPTIGNLGRVRTRFGNCLSIPAVPISRDNFDLRVSPQLAATVARDVDLAP